MKNFFLIVLILFISNLSAQKKDNAKSSKNLPELTTLHSKEIKKAVSVKKTYGYVCSYIEDDLDESKKLCDFFKGKSFTVNQNAEIALNKILSSIGASKTFILQECSGVNNASATSYKGIRYIFYNNSFMSEIANRTNSWSNLSILAHEVGHHINGHTMDMILYANDVVKPVSKEKSREQELEADYFSGFVMSKLGANLSQATQVMAMISSDADDTDSSHPAKSKRLAAITNGFKSGYVKPKVVINNPTRKTKTKTPPKPKVLTYEDYFYKAVDKHQSKEESEALKLYSKSIELNSKFAPAYHNRGVLLDDLKQYKKAIEDYDKAINLIPEYPLYYFNRAITKNNLDDYNGVISDLNKVIENDPENVTAMKFRGQTYYNLKKFKNAINDFTMLIAFDDKISDVYNLMGMSKGFLDKHEEAIEDFNKAISLNPNKDIYYKNRSVSKIKTSNYVDALKDYSKLIELDNSNIKSYLDRANLNYYLKNKDDACEDWTTAKKLGSKEAKSNLKKFCRSFEMKKEMKNDDKDFQNFKKKFDEALNKKRNK